MARRGSYGPDRRAVGAVAVGVIATAGIVASTPVSADVDVAARRCFSVAGDVGDAAVVNLTPVRASGRGFGQLVSSSVPVGDPAGSNVNFVVGSTDPNVAVAAIGADGRVCFQNSDDASVDLIADHLGTVDGSVFTPATPDGAPDRGLDTRFDPDIVRPECLEPVSAEYVTATARTMFGISSRAYEIDPGATTGAPLSESGDTTDVDFEDQMSCWVLVATIRARGLASLGPITDPAAIEVFVQSRSRRPSPFDELTDRERQVLSLVAEGLRNSAVAERLELSEKSVEKHINSIFSKLHLTDEAQSNRRVRSVLLWLAEQ